MCFKVGLESEEGAQASSSTYIRHLRRSWTYDKGPDSFALLPG